MTAEMTARRTPEIAATAVNAALVLFLPLIVAALVSLFPNNTQSVAIGHLPGWSRWTAVKDFLKMLVTMAAIMAPLAAVTAWRTWVHATRWREGERSLRGIAEAAGVGFATVFIPLLIAVLPHLTTNPVLTWFYPMFYAMFGLIVGLCLGVVLELVAVVIMTLGTHEPI